MRVWSLCCPPWAAVRRTGGAAYYRDKVFAGWIKLFGIEVVSRGFFLVQYVPYPSSRYHPLPDLLPSQHYSFTLVRQKLKSGCPVVVMRAARQWRERVPGLDRAFTRNNPRSPSLNPPTVDARGNISKEAARQIYQALKAL